MSALTNVLDSGRIPSTIGHCLIGQALHLFTQQASIAFPNRLYGLPEHLADRPIYETRQVSLLSTNSCQIVPDMAVHVIRSDEIPSSHVAFRRMFMRI